ncbi:MAG: glycosyltransferase family 2 protein [Imperialibacter sp.]|uniref:glycosyltransferase family 2 protein n=1 Tax=Imperialibacter sp. TaxID=2038411 RepID=UPI003A8A8675
MSPKVAVAILNFNGKDYLDRFMPSVIDFSPEADIWVIDNASTDGSVDFLKKNFLDVKIITLEENLGYAGGYQAGLAQIDADYYVLLNSDVEVTEGWLQPMISLLEADETIAACQPKILSWHLRDTFEYAGAAGGFIDILGYPFCRGRVFETLEKDSGQYNDQLEVFWATGACLFIRSTAFNEAGGLDATFFAHMEEIDLCWRLKMAGYSVYYQGESVVYHVGGGTLDSSNAYKTYLNFRNSIVLLLKNDVSRSLWWKIPVRFSIDFLILLRFLVSGKADHAKAISNAHVFIVRNFSKYRPAQPKKALKMLTGAYKGIAPLAYLAGNKVYSKLRGRIQ